MTDVNDVTLCACANLRKVARKITQTYDAALKPTGLKTTQFNILATVEKTGDLPISQLAEQLVMERTTLTRNLTPLINKGYIRVNSQSDQRIKSIHLTKSGRAILEEALPHWKNIQSKVAANLGPQDFTGLLQTLNKTLDVTLQL